jgi:hypothetical protein
VVLFSSGGTQTKTHQTTQSHDVLDRQGIHKVASCIFLPLFCHHLRSFVVATIVPIVFFLIVASIYTSLLLNKQQNPGSKREIWSNHTPAAAAVFIKQQEAISNSNNPCIFSTWKSTEDIDTEQSHSLPCCFCCGGNHNMWW